MTVQRCPDSRRGVQSYSNECRTQRGSRGFNNTIDEDEVKAIYMRRPSLLYMRSDW